MNMESVCWSARIGVFGLILALLPLAQAADDAAKSNAPSKAAEPAAQATEPQIQVVPVTIHPAAESKPALKYHLLPTFLEQTPGNAVPLYAKALVCYKQSQCSMCLNAGPDKKTDLDYVVEWLEMPLDKLPLDRVRQTTLGRYHSLDEAVRREYCNWEPPLRQGNIFEITLPEMQELTALAHEVALRARLEIAEGKCADAIKTMQVGYSMARHVVTCPFLVTGLMGNRIIERMNEQLLMLCQQPNVPNLYWSITELPHPMIDTARAVECEYDGLYLQYPELQNIRKAQNVPEQWTLVLQRFVAAMVQYQEMFKKKPDSDTEQAAKVSKIVAELIEVAPDAKVELRDMGYAEKDLDAMAPSQVIVLHAVETYERLRDDVFKWWHLPYWQAQEGIEAFDRNIQSVKKQERIPVASLIMPGLHSGAFSFVRPERQLAVLRCIEALRLYTAAHEGKLPASLDDIKQVPIPLNPVTGKPFPYRLEGETAILDADGGPIKQPRPQYRITLAKK